MHHLYGRVFVCSVFLTVSACSTSSPSNEGEGEGEGEGVKGEGEGEGEGEGARVPAWLQSIPLNTWVEIPGTVLAGSPGAPQEDPQNPYAQSNLAIGAYSGMALRPDTSEIYVAAAGGHNDTSDNAVRSIRLDLDAPVWQLRSPASAEADRQRDVAYYLDGKPTSRHTYWSSQWSSTRGRVMLHRTRFAYGTPVSFDDSNGFDPVTNTWDPDGTWADGHTAQVRDADDAVWAMSRYSLFKWTPSTDTWTLTRDFGGDEFPHGPLAFDTTRRHLFALAWGDGQGYGLDALNAWRITADGTVRDVITFAPSDALTQFSTTKPPYAALDYDPDYDRYVFFAAQAGAMDHIYVVTPNETTTWEMDLLELNPGVVPVDAGPGGLMNKFQYVPALHGFVLLTSTIKPLYFLRTFDG